MQETCVLPPLNDSSKGGGDIPDIPHVVMGFQN